VAIVASLKMLTRRKRPKLNNNSDMVYGTNSGVDFYSFPSGHSSRAIMLANVVFSLFYHYDKNSSAQNTLLKIVTFLLLNTCSFLTCFSRLMLLRHHLSDVLVGILVGYITYFLVLYICF
jgi:membrane-associated phospholipid phosphatase